MTIEHPRNVVLSTSQNLNAARQTNLRNPLENAARVIFNVLVVVIIGRQA